jgi:hypothetical protein
MLFPQVALNMMKSSECLEQEMARQRDHRQLFDMIAVLLEEVRKTRPFLHSEVPQPREPAQVSLAWPYCVDA